MTERNSKLTPLGISGFPPNLSSKRITSTALARELLPRTGWNVATNGVRRSLFLVHTRTGSIQ
jgi:hypothetical protein